MKILNRKGLIYPKNYQKFQYEKCVFIIRFKKKMYNKKIFKHKNGIL